MKNIAGETWKPVAGWEHLYQVSDMGRVRSLDSTATSSAGWKYHRRGRVLAAPVGSNGYRIVTLAEGDRREVKAVHRLVMDAFCPAHKAGQVITHINGDKSDSRVENMRWVGRGESHVRGTHCSRGHRLEEPNLTATERRCLACTRTRAVLSARGGGYEESDFRAIADGKYAGIMEG